MARWQDRTGDDGGHPMRVTLTAMLTLVALPVMAADLPPCARTGAATVTINGRPALKLGDVALCPPGSFSIVQGMTIEGQPMVQFNPAGTDCLAGSSADVIVDGQGANRLGDITCAPK